MYKLIFHDIKEGIIKNKRFIAVLLWFITFSVYALLFPLYSINHKDITSFDLLLYFYKGEDPMFDAVLTGEPFEFPIFWMMNFILLLFVVMHYMYNDLNGFGIQYIVRIKKRITWWISKCIWCFCSCFIFFFICVLVAFAVTVLIGGKTFDFTNSYSLMEKLANDMNYYCMKFWGDMEVSTGQVIMCELVVPFMVSWAVCQIQMTLTLFLKPTVSFIVNCAFILVSAYIQNYIPGLFISCGMTLHNINFVYEGFSTSYCVLSCFIAIFISFLIGAIKFKKYNFVEE